MLLSPEPCDNAWDRGTRLSFNVLPYVLLVLSMFFTQLNDDRGVGSRLFSLGLGALAGLWMFGMVTSRSNAWRQNSTAMFCYFVVLTAVNVLLVLHNELFFVFALIGFLHAFLMRPVWLAVLGVAVTSAMINLLPGGFKDPFGEDFAAILMIFLLQTVAISGGTLSGIKLHEESESRRRTVAELEAAMQENAELHAQLVTQARETGVQQERQRMARELHDTLAQGLTGIVTQLQAAKRARGGDQDWQRHVDNAANLARESLSEARRSVHAVRPEVLESNRLGEAVSQVADRWSEINSIPIEVVTTGTVLSMRTETELVLLRTAQEALANVAKHAQATRVGLTLSYMEDLVRLDVRDDGIGFNRDQVRVSAAQRSDGGFGLTAMRQRVQDVDGVLEVESEPGGGTAISASVPVGATGGAP